MKHIHVLLGKTLSGKSYVQKELETLYVSPIITSTTRPKRANETNGINYHFVDNKQYQKDIADHKAICIREYNVAHDQTWAYYLNTEQLNQLNPQNSIILDYEGFKDLKDYIVYHNLEITLHVWYLNIDLKTRIDRHFKYRYHEDETEMLRRLYKDEIAFQNILNDSDVQPIKGLSDILSTIYYIATKNKKG